MGGSARGMLFWLRYCHGFVVAIVGVSWCFLDRVITGGVFERVWGMEQAGDRRVEHATEPVVRAVEPFERFYRREFDAAVRLAYVLSGSRSAAEDLAQEAFMEAHRRWDEVGGYESPGGWVRRVISNRSVSWYRRRSSELRALVKVVAGSRRELESLEPESEEVWQAVRRLPPRQAQVVALTYLEDLSLQQIADLLGVSVPTVGTHLQRARKSLAAMLRTDEGVV